MKVQRVGENQGFIVMGNPEEPASIFRRDGIEGRQVLKLEFGEFKKAGTWADFVAAHRDKDVHLVCLI